MSYYFTLNYPENLKPCSVSNLLQKLLLPRKWRHFLRTEHKILINGNYRYFNQLVYPADKVEIFLDHVECNQNIYPPSGQNPDVIFEDRDILIINKPTGQKTHPNSCETTTALNDCATYLKHTPYIVHRLDMLTSGLLLVAKNPAIVPILNHELTAKIFHREYIAIIAQADSLPENGSIKLPIGQDPQDQRKRMVCSNGLKSCTHYQVLKRFTNQNALVKLSLETGRTHQIRVHLAAVGCPIVGDPLYNPQANPDDFLHLTAFKISLVKPFTFNQLSINLPHDRIIF